MSNEEQTGINPTVSITLTVAQVSTLFTLSLEAFWIYHSFFSCLEEPTRTMDLSQYSPCSASKYNVLLSKNIYL